MARVSDVPARDPQGQIFSAQSCHVPVSQTLTPLHSKTNTLFKSNLFNHSLRLDARAPAPRRAPLSPQIQGQLAPEPGAIRPGVFKLGVMMYQQVRGSF